MIKRDTQFTEAIPIMSFYFGPVNVGWIYIEPPHFEIRTFKRDTIDFDTLVDYYPDIVLVNLHMKFIRAHFADSYILRIHSKDVKEMFKTTPTSFESYKVYFEKIINSLSTSTAEPSYKCPFSFSPTELKSLKQLVYTLHLLEMDKYITHPLLTEEDV